MPFSHRPCAGVEVRAYLAAELEEDAEGREDDGEDEVDEGRRAVRHRSQRSGARGRGECIRATCNADGSITVSQEGFSL